ncbi:hypothetical protein [Synechococcus sp. UW105]|uniref:hypothetical protein n=1 Tax=Synechococcus sp. UW105 TaxID=337067 RepID=UPI0010BE0048|nr:hypothetical protein [Synechococcus sp. UW105]
MAILNVMVCTSLMFWASIGIFTHIEWFESIFRRESDVVARIQSVTSTSATRSNHNDSTLTSRKGFVFAYWDEGRGHRLSVARSIEQEQSPLIFNLASLGLVAFTSVFFLIVVSKGLIHALGLA